MIAIGLLFLRMLCDCFKAAGISILSWSAYFASALLWLWFGIRRRDRNIYLPCFGWIALDGAVIAGAVVYG